LGYGNARPSNGQHHRRNGFHHETKTASPTIAGSSPGADGQHGGAKHFDELDAMVDVLMIRVDEFRKSGKARWAR